MGRHLSWSFNISSSLSGNTFGKTGSRASGLYFHVTLFSAAWKYKFIQIGTLWVPDLFYTKCERKKIKWINQKPFLAGKFQTN